MSADDVDVDVDRLRRQRRMRLAGKYVLLTVLAAVVLFPIYITIVDSLAKPAQIFTQPGPIVPTHFDVDSYSRAWDAGHLGTYLKNSAIVTVFITVGQVVTAILAGYAFAFLEFPFKRTAVRGVPGHVDGAVRGDHRHQRRDHQ